jgi:hypothetical protein
LVVCIEVRLIFFFVMAPHSQIYQISPFFSPD